MSHPRRIARPDQPLYARVLRLRNLTPSGLLCFVFLEGAVVLGVLLALAELVSWWGVVVLPVTVALMVKFNDLVAGAFVPQPVATGSVPARATEVRSAAMPSLAEEAATTVVVRPAENVRPGGFGPAGAVFTRAAGVPAPGRAGLYGPVSTGGGLHGSVSTEGGLYGSASTESGLYGPVSAEGGLYGSVNTERATGLRPDFPGPVTGPAPIGRPDNHMIQPTVAVGDHGPDAGFPPTGPGDGTVRPTVLPVTGGYGPMTEQRQEHLGSDPATPVDGMPHAPAVGYPGSYSRGPAGDDYLSSFGGPGNDRQYDDGQHDDGQHQVRFTVDATVEEPRGTNAPVRRAWADDLDVRQQMARQAASRRYE